MRRKGVPVLAGGVPRPVVVRKAPVLSEARFQAQVVKLAKLRGWVAFHVYSSRRCLPGWPDLILLRPPVALAWELKTVRGRVTPEQTAMLALLGACGFDARVIRPSAWDEIERVLS